MKNFIYLLIWMFLINASVHANKYDNQIDLAMSKMVEAFEAEGGSRKIDDYTDLIKIQYNKERKIILLTHEVDIGSMLNKEYLDKSDAWKIKSANKIKACLSGFGVLLKNKLIKIEHVFLDNKANYIVLRYFISSDDCDVENEK